MSTSRISAQYTQEFTGAESGKDAALTLKENAIKFWDHLWATYNESYAIISGDYYTGQVEDYEYEPLGVFLDDIEASDSEFLENENVIVWATLKAYTLEDNNISIKVTCSAKDGTKTIKGVVTPKNGEFNVESYDEDFITCTFSDKYKNKISEKPGYYSVIFNATFNFTTQSYLKVYYIEKKRKRVLMTEGIDIFSEYGITDTSPVAKFTNGPLKIGMGTTTSQPIGVPLSNKNEFSSYIGLTLDNNWEGNVKSINKIYIGLPDGLSFRDTCEDFEDNRRAKNNGYSHMVKEKIIREDNKKKYELPKSYKCSLKLDNARSLLGNTPISIKYFKAEVDYVYHIEEKTSVTVKSERQKTT